MFRPLGWDDTKLRRDETVFRYGEDVRKPALGKSLTYQMKGRKGP
jgi:chromosome condensin MukBEF MukE localization factor